MVTDEMLHAADKAMRGEIAYGPKRFETLKRGLEAALRVYLEKESNIALTPCLCRFCGRTEKDRPLDRLGHPLDIWNTEIDCGCRLYLAEAKSGST